MRARSVLAACAVALAVVSRAGANFQASASVAQGAISTATVAAPSTFTATCVKNSSYTVNFAWTALGAPVDGYAIYSGTSPGSYPTLVATLSGGGTASASQTLALTKNTTYYFAIKSTARTWTSVFSAASSFTTGSGKC
jgi:hypothetical protein